MVAFIDLEPDGHIDRLFCAPEAVGRGIASQLYDGIETAARERGIGRLFTEASAVSVPPDGREPVVIGGHGLTGEDAT